MRKLGLTFSWRMKCFLWAVNGGAWWIPKPIAKLIVHVGNSLLCRIYGHDDVLWHLVLAGELTGDSAQCTNCCASLTACTVTHRRGP